MDNMTIKEFSAKLSSSDPVPGGGGASALAGCLSAALCSMVASLTSGKKKYAQYQEDIEKILLRTAEITDDMRSLIRKDAECFEPLSKAYGIPKDTPGRDALLEDALRTAVSAPYEILRASCEILPLLSELSVKGSAIAVSDVGVAAAMCRAAAEGAVLNVYINTKLMKDRAYAENINKETADMAERCVSGCALINSSVESRLKGENR